MTLDKITLVNIYTECNNHLREMDKLRDQLISFYLIFVGAFFTVSSAKQFNNYLMSLSIFLTVLGIFVSLLITEYRIWHTRYSYTAQLLVALSRGRQKDWKKIERDARERAHQELHTLAYGKPYRMTWDWLKNRYVKGTEFYTFTASLILTCIPVYFLLSYILNVNLYILLCFVVLYFLTYQIYSAQKTYREFARCPWAKWIMYGIGEDEILVYDT